MDATKPYKSTGFVDIHDPKPYKFIGFVHRTRSNIGYNPRRGLVLRRAHVDLLRGWPVGGGILP
jgi:hypothetical protein